VNDSFEGTINGNNHVIYGLYCKDDRANNSAGLIPIIKMEGQSYINDLGINCVYLKASKAGGFVGNTSIAGHNDLWYYEQNHSIVNLNTKTSVANKAVGFKPISKLQLLAFNTGESYPFADRLIEYLVGSAITPLDEISDNIRRTQHVIKQNNHYYRHDGIWENKIQKIIYDYMINAGPIEYDAQNAKLIDKHQGYQKSLGKKHKSLLFDVLGYVDKDAEKYYASWTIDKKDPASPKAKVKDTIQNANIYGKLYDI
jgi:hypothetical protein